MTETRIPYPKPAEDAVNTPLLDGWRSGVLTIQRCADCGHTFFYPRPMCPECWSEQLAWIETKGQGEIVSFSIVHRPVHDSFKDEGPVVLAEIRLPEGTSLLARVLLKDPATAEIGLKVRLLSPKKALAYPLPTFEPDR